MSTSPPPRSSSPAGDHNPFSLSIDACQLGLPDLKITRVLTNREKQSSSNTIIAFGEIQSRRVVVKISFRELDRQRERDNSVSVERDVYKTLVPRMMLETPNLMTFVGIYECHRFSDFLRRSKLTSVARPMLREMQSMRIRRVDRKLDFEHAFFMVTERSEGRPLSEWYGDMEEDMADEAERNEFLLDVLSQIAYTLIVFRRFGFIHNDLHDANVFVNRVDPPHRAEFKMDDGSVHVRDVRYFVQIYDFDHGSKVATKHDPTVIYNTMLRSWACRELGECNEFLENRDWFNILYYIWRGTGHQTIKDLIPQRLRIQPAKKNDKNNGKSTGLLAWSGRPCICADRYCDSCKLQRSDLKTMMSLDDFIQRYTTTGKDDDDDIMAMDLDVDD